jgi:cobalt-zinc-cadmium efflux system outer membrane protein
MANAARILIRLAGLGCGAVLAAGALAQPAPPPREVDLQSLLALVRETSPRIALAEQAVAAAHADRIAAGAYPNPVVGYGRMRPGSGSRTVLDADRQDDIEIELPLLLPGQRSARIGAADAGIEAARAEAMANGSMLVVEAGEAFVALLAAQERSAILAAAAVELDRLRGIVAGRQRSGHASRYDLARLDVELGSWRTRSREANADIADASGRLAALAGLPDWRPQALGPLEPLADDTTASPQVRADIQDDIEHPAVLAARRQEQAAAAAVAAARTQRWPEVSVNLGRSRTSGPHGSANYIGLSVEVPLFDTRRGALERARAEARAATLRSALTRTETLLALERHAQLAGHRRAALASFDESAGDQLPALRRMAQDAYTYGRGSIVELIDAVRADFELRLARVDLVAALVEAQLRLQAAQGRLR